MWDNVHGLYAHTMSTSFYVKNLASLDFCIPGVLELIPRDSWIKRAPVSTVQ